MRFREYPLLNTPNLMAIILREASAGPATLARLRSAAAGAAGRAPTSARRSDRRRWPAGWRC